MSYEISCPVCGNGGTVRESENDYPFMKRVAHMVDHVPDGFKVTKHNDTGHGTEITCMKCKVLAK
jgi:hypothetical protein